MRKFKVIGAIATFALAAFGYSPAIISSALASEIRKSDALPSPQKLQLHQAIEIARALRASHRQPAVFKNAGSSPFTPTAAGVQAISGTVTTSDGVPPQRLKIIITAFTIDSSQTPSKGFAYADPSGSYVIENLLPGDFIVVAQAEGYEIQYYKLAATMDKAQLVRVLDSDTTTGIDFKLEKIAPGTGVISGEVIDKTGAPIANANIGVFSRDNPFYYGGALTQNDGTYRVEALKSGNYFVQIWADGYISEFYDNARTPEQATLVAVNEPNETSNINFMLSTGGAISGQVADKDNKPIVGAIVQAYFAKPDSLFYRGFGMALTEEDGTYKIIGLEPGAYVVSAEAWTPWSYAQQWYKNVGSPDSATVIQVEEEQAVTGIDFTLDLPKIAGSINGVVTNLKGEPLADASIQAYSPADSIELKPRFWGYANTDSSGRYRIDLPAGDYIVMASAYNGWQSVVRWYPNVSTPDSAVLVTVETDVDREGIDFKLPIVNGDGVIAGQVTAEDGRALAGAFIEVMPATTEPAWKVWAYGSTDSTGHYFVDKLPPGQYFVHAQYWENDRFGEQWYLLADSREQATAITLEESQKIDDIDFKLKIKPIYGSIFGRVTADANGAPIPRAYVEISPLKRNYYSGAPIAFWNWNTVTNERGEYHLDLLPEGEYLVSVYANSAFEYFENAVVPEQATPVKVIGGDSVQAHFGLTPRDEGNGVITGTVVEEFGNAPLPIAVVIARPTVAPQIWPQSEMFFTAVTEPDGSYKMAGLAPGEYYVTSFGPGYIAEYYENAFDPSEAKPVKVDGVTAAEKINFSLFPIYTLESNEDPRASVGAGVIGKVNAKSGKGIAGAHVYVFNDIRQPIAFNRTDAEGKYEVNGVPPGRYRLLASHSAFNSKYNDDANQFAEAKPVDLGLGKVEVNFVLDPKGTTGVGESPNAPVPQTVELYGNYPNPFNPETQIVFGLPAALRVKLRIFNVLGEEVAVLQDGLMSAGVHRLTWNGRNQAGREMSTGLYLYRLESPAATLLGKMLLLR